MSEYTKGPWKFYKATEFSGSESFPYLVAVDYGVGPSGSNVIGCRMSEPNARLMSASPDLLKALKYVLQMRGVVCHHPDGYDDICARCRADKAISAATSSPVVVKTGGGE